jgi:hypothetical protein
MARAATATPSHANSATGVRPLIAATTACASNSTCATRVAVIARARAML